MPRAPRPEIRPLAAAAFGTALRAMEQGDRPAAVRALLDIDSQSWDAIEARLARLGGTVAELLQEATP